MAPGHVRRRAVVLAIVMLLAVFAITLVFAIKNGGFLSTRSTGVARGSRPALAVPSVGYSPPVTRTAAIETVKRDRAEIERGATFAAKLVGAPSSPTWLVEVHGRFHPMNAGSYTWGEFTINATTGAVLGVNASNSPLGTWTAETDQLAQVG